MCVVWKSPFHQEMVSRRWSVRPPFLGDGPSPELGHFSEGCGLGRCLYSEGKVVSKRQWLQQCSHELWFTVRSRQEIMDFDRVNQILWEEGDTGLCSSCLRWPNTPLRATSPGLATCCFLCWSEAKQQELIWQQAGTEIVTLQLSMHQGLSSGLRPGRFCSPYNGFAMWNTEHPLIVDKDWSWSINQEFLYFW